MASNADQALVDQLLAGDEGAFSALIAKHHRAMVHLAMGYVSGRAMAEEVVQETWLAVLKGLPRFQGRSTLKTWIFRILINRAKTRATREGRTIPMSALGSEDSEEPGLDPSRFTDTGHWSTTPKPWMATPEKLALNAEARKAIDAAIETLPPRQKAVIVMRDIDGWSTVDVCNVLEISDTNQRVLLHRARSKVRAALEAVFGTED